MANIKFAGFFGQNFGDDLLHDIAKDYAQFCGHEVVTESAEYGILLGGGLSESSEGNKFYLSQLRGCDKKIALSIGLNPIMNWMAQEELRENLKEFHYISVRDEGSLVNLKRLGLSADVAPDIAFAIDYHSQISPDFTCPNNMVVIVPVRTNWQSVYDFYWFYKELYLGVKAMGYTPIFCSFHPDREVSVLREFYAGQVVWKKEDIYGLMREAKAVIAGRYHALILALMLTENAIVPLTYNFKLQELSHEFGLSMFEHACGNGRDGLMFELDSRDVLKKLERALSIKSYWNSDVPLSRLKSKIYGAQHGLKNVLTYEVSDASKSYLSDK